MGAHTKRGIIKRAKKPTGRPMAASEISKKLTNWQKKRGIHQRFRGNYT